jgi:hypothetical protein
MNGSRTGGGARAEPPARFPSLRFYSSAQITLRGTPEPRPRSRKTPSCAATTRPAGVSAGAHSGAAVLRRALFKVGTCRRRRARTRISMPTRLRSMKLRRNGGDRRDVPSRVTRARRACRRPAATPRRPRAADSRSCPLARRSAYRDDRSISGKPCVALQVNASLRPAVFKTLSWRAVFS